MNFDDNDIHSMALCVWKEARGEGGLGMQAVANVIANRARAWYSSLPDPIHTAVYAKNQFTSMSVPSDPEFNLEPADNDPQFDYCVNLCGAILGAEAMPSADPTHGALYYCNLHEATSGWFFDNIVAKTAEHPQVAAIGKQLFYR